MKFVKNLNQLNKEDVSSAGGKGAALGETIRSGIAVPVGFVILSNAFEKFLKDNKLDSKIDKILEKIDYKNINELESSSQKITGLILDARLSDNIAKEIREYFEKLNLKLVAVRSSATAEDDSKAAWAGQMESYLNVEAGNLLESVKKCWASFFASRALCYRFEKNLGKQKISLAIVVQKMVDSESAGVAFSINPADGNNNQVIIEAGFGLGEAVVSGRINPDRYVVTKDLLDIVEKTIESDGYKSLPQSVTKKQKLSDRNIVKLVDLTIKLEKYFGFPVDIEWAVERQKIFVLQTRPITAIRKKSLDIWSNVNLAEVIPGINPPLVADYMIKGVGPAIRKMLCISETTPIMKSFKGRLYFNIFAINVAVEKILKIKNFSLIKFFGGADYRKKEMLASISLRVKIRLIILTSFAFLGSAVAKWRREKLTRLISKNIQKFQEQCAQANDLSELLAIERKYRSHLFPTIIKGVQGVLASIFFYFAFVALSDKWVGKGGANKLLKSGGDHLQFIQVFNELWILSRRILGEKILARKFMKTKNTQEAELAMKQAPRVYIDYQKFLGKYGHRCVNELNFSIPRWAEDPEFIIAILKEYMNAPDQSSPLLKKKKIYEEHKKTSRQIWQKLPWWKVKVLKFLYKLTQNGLREREYLKSEIVKSLTPLRSILLRIGNELVTIKKIGAPEDIFMLVSKEFDNLTQDNLKVLDDITKRKAKYKEYKNISMPETMDSNENPIEVAQSCADQIKGTLQGVAVGGGIVEGRARIVTDIKNISILEPGDILVTDHTDPGWTPIFVTIKGVITNRGGLLSHAAIVAREYGLPAVVNAPNATSFIKDGQNIILDGCNGTIQLK